MTAILVSALTGCAAVGPPIAPEEIGIESKIRKHQNENQSQEIDSEYPEVFLEEENVGGLPESYPIGTR